MREIEIDANSNTIKIGSLISFKMHYCYETMKILDEIFNYLGTEDITFTYVDEDKRKTIYES
jgi:hypothetical protein